MNYDLEYLKEYPQYYIELEKFCCDVLIRDYEDTKGKREDCILENKIKKLKKKRSYLSMMEVSTANYLKG